MKNQKDSSQQYGRRIAAPHILSNNKLQRSAVLPIEVLHVNRRWQFSAQFQGKMAPARCESKTRPPTRKQLRM